MNYKYLCLIVLLVCCSFMFSACDLGFKPASEVSLDISNVKVSLNYGEELDLSNLKITVKNGSEVEELTFDDISKSDIYEIDYGNFNKNKAGNYSIAISRAGKKVASFVVSVVDNLQSVEIIGSIRENYIINEELDFGDAYLKSTYASGRTETINFDDSRVRITGNDFSTSGNKKIYVYYSNYIFSFDVVVYGIQITDMQLVAPTKTEYNLYENIDLTGGKIILTYSNLPAEYPAELAPSELPLTDERVGIFGFDTSSIGDKLIRVSYSGIVKEFAINVNYSINQNEYILSFKVNGEQVDLLNTDYIEFQDGVVNYVVDVVTFDDYVIVFNGEQTERTPCVVGNINAFAYQKEIDSRYYKESGYELVVFIYDRESFENSSLNAQLIFSKKLGFYRRSFITSLTINGVEFERIDNDTYASVGGAYVPNRRNISLDYQTLNDYKVTFRRDSATSIYYTALEQHNRLIIDVYEEIVYEEIDEVEDIMIQSFFVSIECDPMIFQEMLDEIVLSGATYNGATTFSNKKLYTTIVDVPSTTEKIYIDLGRFNSEYTIMMFRNGQSINCVSGTDIGWYYVNPGINVFEMQLDGETNRRLIRFIVNVLGGNDAFADEYIASLKLQGVEAEFVMFENKYLLHIPYYFTPDAQKFSVVFEDAYSDYSFDIEDASVIRKRLNIYNGDGVKIRSYLIDLVRFGVASNDTSFLTLYTSSGDGYIEINVLEFDSNKNATINNCMQNATIQFTMIGNYKEYSVTSNCIGLADKTETNFAGFIVQTEAENHYIDIKVTATNGRESTYHISINF